MIGRGRVGTTALGGGVAFDTVTANAETADATVEMGLPLAYNGLVRAGYATARASVFQAIVRSQPGRIRPYLLRVPSQNEKVWNGKAWVPVLVDQWANEPLTWNGEEWVEPTQQKLPQQRVWNGERWVP